MTIHAQSVARSPALPAIVPFAAAHENHVAQFVRETSICATAKEIRKIRKVHGEVVESLRTTQQRNSKSADGRVLAEAAMTESQSAQQAPMLGELISAWGEALEARRELKAAEQRENKLERELRNKEAGFAQSELLDFITQRKYARNPLGLG